MADTPMQDLPKAERLGSKEINQIFETGALGKSHFFIVRCLPNGLSHSRMAPIVGKKSGKAFLRNRIKRLIRQLYRTNKDRFPGGFDYAFVARAGIPAASAEELLSAMTKAVSRACAESRSGAQESPQAAPTPPSPPASASEAAGG